MEKIDQVTPEKLAKYFDVTGKALEKVKIVSKSFVNVNSDSSNSDTNEINEIKYRQLKICAIVITLYENEPKALKFRRKLKKLGYIN